MTILLMKRGKYLAGFDYATGLGHSFHWCRNIDQARRFHEGEGALEAAEQQTGAYRVEVPKTRKELKEAGRRAMAANDMAEALRRSAMLIAKSAERARVLGHPFDPLAIEAEATRAIADALHAPEAIHSGK